MIRHYLASILFVRGILIISIMSVSRDVVFSSSASQNRSIFKHSFAWQKILTIFCFPLFVHDSVYSDNRSYFEVMYFLPLSDGRFKFRLILCGNSVWRFILLKSEKLTLLAVVLISANKPSRESNRSCAWPTDTELKG